MDFMNNNFESLFSLLIIVVILIISTYVLMSKPSKKRKEIILTWLLQIVIESERLFKSNTGQIKFSYVYNEFIKQFPIVSKFMPKEVFSELVNKSLEQMKHLIETNKEVKKYIEGDK